MLFRLGVVIRDFFFAIGLKKRTRSSVKSIGIGNLTVGGTGKTPFSEFLIRHYKDNRSVSFLSRGYGRSTKGFIQASDDTTAKEIGDEPQQVWEKFKEDITVQVCEKRVVGVEAIKNAGVSDLIILDDVFQHRMIIPTVNILLNNYQLPFQSDYLLPAGRLRDARTNAKYADVVVYTKCPDLLTEDERERLEKEVRSYAGDKPVFFSKMVPGDVRLVSGENEMGPYITLSAIADSSNFERNLETVHGSALVHHRFKDHYDVSDEEMQVILKEVKDRQAVLVMTEKDWARIKHKNVVSAFQGGIFVLPIEVELIEKETEFWNIIEQRLDS
jgi:tetraacyldisaccharide 4'-kinase